MRENQEHQQETAPLDATEAESVESVPESPDGSAPATEAPGGSDEGADVEEGAGKAAKEAARYRRQLRDVEAERDGLRTQVEALQRAAVESTLPGHVKAEALWSRASLGDLVGEDGTVAPERVAEAVRDVEQAYGVRPQVGPRISTNGRRSNTDGRSQPGGIAGMARAIER